jgi:hypothetical protein
MPGRICRRIWGRNSEWGGFRQGEIAGRPVEESLKGSITAIIADKKDAEMLR